MNHLDLLGHPVLACFVAMKWDRLLAYFYAHTAMFFVFLANYYGYIVYLMTSNIDQLMVSKGQEDNRNCKNYTITLPHFLTTWDDSGFFVCELLFLLSSLIFLCSEIVQMVRLGKYYWKEHGNYIQLFVILSAFLAMGLKPWLLGDIQYLYFYIYFLHLFIL